MISFSATFDINSKRVELLDTTISNDSGKLSVGMYVYSSAVKSCTKITTIIDENTIEISSFPISNGQSIAVFTCTSPYKYLESCEALKDVQAVVNGEGTCLQYNFRGESNISRDEYRGITNRTRDGYVMLKAHPVTFNPTQDQIEKAGFFERYSVICWLSAKDFIDRGLDFSDIDEIRDTFVVQNETYKISEKNRVGAVGDTFLYYTIAGRKV